MDPRPSYLPPILCSAFAAAVVFASLLFGADAEQPDDGSATVSTTNAAISPKDEADALHVVIAAEREAYCRAYLAAQATASSGRAGAVSNEAWPLPAEMFRRAAESIPSKGVEFSYALRSLHPLNPRNGPQTELEQRGLTFIASHPTQPYYGRETLGGRRYLTAGYPDLPASAACIECHQRRSSTTPRADHVGEPMGAIVVRIPLEF